MIHRNITSELVSQSPNKQFSSEAPNCKQVPLKVSKKKISETIQFIFIFLNIREIYLNVSSFLRDSPEVC